MVVLQPADYTAASMLPEFRSHRCVRYPDAECSLAWSAFRIGPDTSVCLPQERSRELGVCTGGGGRSRVFPSHTAHSSPSGPLTAQQASQRWQARGAQLEVLDFLRQPTPAPVTGVPGVASSSSELCVCPTCVSHLCVPLTHYCHGSLTRDTSEPSECARQRQQ